MAPGALSGLRVLEFASFISGPLAAQMLADLGAEVVKVEPPRGDAFREGKPHKYASHFQAHNRNKRSIVLDLTQPGSAAIVRRLVSEADVVIVNMRPGVAERLGIAYDDVVAENPSVVYCAVTGQGKGGPRARRPTFDTTAQAASGLASLLADPEKQRPYGPTLSDNLGALYALYGIMGALFARQRTGRGQRVDVSMLRATLAFLSDAVSRYFVTGVTPTGEARCAGSQSFLFACSDERIIAFQLSTVAKFWYAMTDAIGRSELQDDPRFDTLAKRTEHYRELYEELEREFAKRPLDDWLRMFDGSGVPHEPVRTVDEALAREVEHDPGFVRTVEHPRFGTFRCVGPGVDLSDTPVEVTLPPPRLGEHTREVLRRHGFSDPEIEAMASEGIIGFGEAAVQDGETGRQPAAGGGGSA